MTTKTQKQTAETMHAFYATQCREQLEEMLANLNDRIADTTENGVNWVAAETLQNVSNDLRDVARKLVR